MLSKNLVGQILVRAGMAQNFRVAAICELALWGVSDIDPSVEMTRIEANDWLRRGLQGALARRRAR